MVLIRGSSFAICLEQAKAKGRGIPDYCLKATGRWTFGYLK